MKTFYVGIKGVIVQDNKVLLIKSSGGRGFWEVPGGRIDDDETVQQTLEREIREEVPNVQSISVGNILSAYRVHRNIVDEISLVLIFYKVSATFDGEIQISHEHTESKWADKTEALEIVEESCREAIASAL